MAIVLLISPGCLDLLGGNTRVDGVGDVVKHERDIKGFTGVHLATVGDMNIEFGPTESIVIEAQENLHDYLDVYVKNDVLIVDTKRGYSLRSDKPVRYFVTLNALDYVRVSSSGDIHAPDITAGDMAVDISSSGDFDMGDLECSKLDIRVSSSGDASIDDIKADRIHLNISSSGNIEAKNVTSPAFEARVSSSGDVRIGTLQTSEIFARLSSSGDIVLKQGEAGRQDIFISSSGNYKAAELNANEAVIRISGSGDAYVDVKENLEAELSSSGSLYYSGNPSLSVKERSSGRVRKAD
jgi:hypothetical protein